MARIATHPARPVRARLRPPPPPLPNGLPRHTARAITRLPCRTATTLAACAIAPLSVAAAQAGGSAADSGAAGQCRRVESRTNLAALSGRRVERFDVAIASPRVARVPLLARLNSRTHVRTQQNTLRRFVLLAPRDTVDTLRVAESLRRLRRLRYLDDVLLVADDCGPGTPVAVTVIARDAASFRPDLRFNSGTAPNAATGTATASPASYSVGFEERNFLGTGRELRASAVGANRRNGFAVGAGDPTVFGSLYAARARLARNPLENATTFSVRPPDRELAEQWRGEFSVASTRRAGAATRGASFARSSGQALLGRRLSLDDGLGTATFLLAGAEGERTRLAAAPGAIVGGPTDVRRDFKGVDVGVARYAEQYGAITWLLPDARVVDVPRGIETEVIVGVGREQLVAREAAHVDAWAGRMWIPADGLLLVADAWTGGYVRRGAPVSGGSTRAALTGAARQRGGYAFVRLAVERLSAPDPDQQALLGFDPTVRILPTRTRLAQTAVVGTAERDWRVTSPRGHLSLDLAGFGAASYRASERTPGADVNQTSTAVGAGAHLVPNALGRSALRLDYVVPVTHGRGGHSRPYLAASVTPWILFDRYRDGRRVR